MSNIKAGYLSDPETGEDLSNVEATLSGLGIKLRNSNAEFRNFGDVLDEVSGKWNTFSSVQQRAIATALGGTRGQEKLLALIENYDSAMEYMNVAANSAGNAAEKYNAYLASIESSSDSFKASFQQLSADVMNSEFVKGTYDVGTGILGFLDALVQRIGVFSTLGSGSGIASIIKNLTKKGDLLSAIGNSDLSGAISDVGQLSQAYMQLNGKQQRAYMLYNMMMKGTSGLTMAQRQNLAATVQLVRQGQTFNVTMAEAALKQEGLNEAQIQGLQLAMQNQGGLKSTTLAYRDQAMAVIEATLAGTNLDAQKKREIADLIMSKAAIDNETRSLRANATARIAMMAADPMSWLSLALMIIPQIVKGIQWLAGAQERQLETQKQNEQAMQSAFDTYDQSKDAAKSYAEQIDELTQKIRELQALESSGRISLVQKDELTELRAENDELQRKLDLQQALANQDYKDAEKSFTDTLTAGHDAYIGESFGNMQAIDVVSSSVEDQIGQGVNYKSIFSGLRQAYDFFQDDLQRYNEMADDAMAAGNAKEAERLRQLAQSDEEYLKNIESKAASIVAQFDDQYWAIWDHYSGDLSKIGNTNLRDIMSWLGDAIDWVSEDATDRRVESILDSDAYKDQVDKIKELAKSGKLTADELNNEDFDGFRKALSDVGVDIDWFIENYNRLLTLDSPDDNPSNIANPVEAYVAKNKSDIGDALSSALSEYSSNGVVAKDTLMALDKAIPGVTHLLLDQNGEWTAAGQAILGYTDNVKGATAELYRLLIAQKQQELAQLNPRDEKYRYNEEQIKNEIDSYQAALDNLRANWRDEITTALSSIDSDSDILAQAINDLNDGTFEEWDSEFVDKLLDAFPDLADEIEAFADGTMDAKDLIEEMQDAADASAWDDFLEALDAVNSAVEEYGEDSYQVQEALENLESIVPGVSALFYTEDGALTDVGQAAILAADGHIDAAEAMLQAALVAAQLDLSNIVSEWNAVAQAADASALSNIKAAYSSQIAAAQGKVDQIKGLLEGLGKKGLGGGGGGSRRGGGGGGSSKKDVLEDYKNQKKILEHRADMSKSAQDLMQEDTDEWRAEQQKQYDIYREYAAMIQAEMERLRKLGYDSESEELMQLESDLAKVKKQMYSLQKEAWKSQQDAQIKALKKQKDAAKEAWEAEKERLEGEIDRQEALIGLLEKQYDLTNNLRDQRTDLAKQLASSKSYIGLSEEERKSLFSDEDYAQLMGVLDDIQREAIIAYNEYTEQIKSVNTDEAYKLDYITQQYEAQYELMNKKYAIAVQDLAVARARIALENAQQNRNIAMIVNGKWTWSADPQAIQDAVEKIYDAEQERADAQSDYIQQEKLNEMEGFKASLELEKEAAQKAYEDFVEHIDKLIEALEEMEFAFDETIENLYDVAGKIEGAGNAIASAAASAAAAISSAGGGGGGGGGEGNNGSPKTKIVSKPLSKHEKPGSKYAEINIIIEEDKNSGKKTGKVYGGSGGGGKNLNMYYADGGVNTQTGTAMMHGTPRAPEVVFNAADAAKLYDIIHNGNPVAAMADQIKAQVHNAAASMANAVPEALQPIQYIINGLKLGDESGNLTLRQFATQLSAAAPFLK